jgi:hypothetical protein
MRHKNMKSIVKDNKVFVLPACQLEESSIDNVMSDQCHFDLYQGRLRADRSSKKSPKKLSQKPSQSRFQMNLAGSSA